MLFVLTAIDRSDAIALRLNTRAAHFDFVRETGVVRLGGPFLNDRGEMTGSMIIFEAADLDAAGRWHAEDPYTKAGLFQSSKIRPWRATANFCEAKL